MTTIEETLGVAVGSIGMSLDDFCAMSPWEFREVHRAYIQAETERLHGEWERMRMLATITVQPHLKKKVEAKKLLPFPWDKKARKARPSTLERFKEIVKKTEDYELDNQHNIQTPGGREDLQGADVAGGRPEEGV